MDGPATVNVDERRTVVTLGRALQHVLRGRRQPLLRVLLRVVAAAVLLRAATLEVVRGREEHRAVDERRYAAEHEDGPRDEDDDGPRGTKAVVEAALEDVAELHGEEREGAVREDDAPPRDAELRELLRAPEDREEREHDPADAHAPEDVRRAEADRVDELACDRDLGEVVACSVGYQRGEVGAVDEQREAALAERRQDVPCREGDKAVGCAMEEEAYEEAEGDHRREGQADDAHGDRKGTGDEGEAGKVWSKGTSEETTAGRRCNHGNGGDDPDRHDFAEVFGLLSEEEIENTECGEPGDSSIEPPEPIEGEQEAVVRAWMPIPDDILQSKSDSFRAYRDDDSLTTAASIRPAPPTARKPEKELFVGSVMCVRAS